ncbi:unnamed protein product [Urochloa humidicola]
MASSRSLALFLLCILLPAPPHSAALLFGAGKSAAAAGLDMEWRPATATWYGDAEGDGSDGKRHSSQLHAITGLSLASTWST